MEEMALERIECGQPSGQGRSASGWLRFITDQRATTLAAAAFLLTVAIMFLYRPLSQLESGDSALYDYWAQSILRGEVPYRDTVEIKAPGSFYLSAVAMEVGRALGMRDVIAARLLHIIMAGLLAAITYLAGEAYLASRAAALMAVPVCFMSNPFAGWVVGGGQPKLPMILFGMLALLLVARDKPIWAGVCSMLSCLCWQPGLIFTGTAVLVFSRYLTSWRDLRAAKLLLGAALPLLGALLYFWHKGALADLWTWTVKFNYSVYRYQAARGYWDAVIHIWRVANKMFGGGIVLVAVGVVGLLGFGFQRLREKLQARRKLIDAGLVGDAIVIVPLFYWIFCLVKFNAGPYLIPFLPFIGIFAGWCVVKTWRLIKTSPFAEKNVLVSSLPGAVVMIVAASVLYQAIAFQFRPAMTLGDQQRSFEIVSGLLAPGDKLYVHGTTELLVLLDKPNMNPYVDLNSGRDDYVAAKSYGGSFTAIIEQIECEAPKIVALSMLGRVTHRDDFTRWVDQHYEPLKVPGYPGIYLRKPSVPEPDVVTRQDSFGGQTAAM
jgi:hypothetical protein